ncbi:hypothetical protein BDZ97DRAFT_1768339 [Flammula alnicola]|nr:hypothetical protein BDZ97DRAFT_1768339 [Flammula alnicola]
MSGHYPRRNIVFSSDNYLPDFDDLPPSDPPEDIETDDEQLDVETTEENPFLTSYNEIPFATSDDIPLQDTIPFATSDDHPLQDDEVYPTSDDVPLASVLRNQAKMRTYPHQRSSSLPAPVQMTMATSDDILFTPRTERRYQMALMTQRRLETMTQNKILRAGKEQEDREREQKSKEMLFDEILQSLQKRGITLSEFLKYVFNPNTRHIFDWKWRGFFRQRETVKEILGYWTSAAYNNTTRTFVADWIIEQARKIIGKESKAILDSNILRKGSMVVDEAFFLNFSLENVTNKLRELAPKAFALFDAFSTTERQKKELKEKSRKRQEMVQGSAILTLLRSKSQNNNYAQSVIGTYLMATGAQRQHFTVFSSLGISTSYKSVITRPTEKKPGPGKEAVSEKEKDNPGNSTSDVPAGKVKKRKPPAPGTLYLLAQACRESARKVARSHLFITVYDNVNMMIKVAEQILGRKNAQENGTCATVIPLHNATLEDLETKHLDEGVMNASPLKLENLLLTEEETELLLSALVHTILSVIVRYGGDQSKHWKEELEKDAPKSSETIAVHKTTVHPLPSMEIDENTITGNIQIIEEINAELKLDPENAEYQKYIKIIAGDQLTIARQRAITGIRLGHEVGLNMWKHFVLVTGLFHAKIADTHGTLLTHFGVSSVRSPGSLAWHNTCLERIPIVLTSLPSFRTCRDLIMISLYGRIFHCLLLVSGEDSLEDYMKNVNSWTTLKGHANEILTKFANADRVQELREPRLAAQKRAEAEEKESAKRKKADAANDVSDINNTSTKEALPTELQGDMVFENACLFLRDALLTRLFADAIKSGDSGLVILVLKQWSFSYRGNGHMKYAHKMLHLLHNLVNVWTKEIWKVVTQNWLLNPTGRANAFVEIDLVQEHLNFWIKRVYKAEGGSHSWDWLAMVSPCVDILRKLSTKINHELGTEQGSKHTIPDLEQDIKTIMKVLQEHDVYEIIPGRVVDVRIVLFPIIDASRTRNYNGGTAKFYGELIGERKWQWRKRKLTVKRVVRIRR